MDSNAAAQEKGLEAIGSLIANSGENAAKTREAVMPAVVEKGFLSVRAGTKQKAIEVAMLYVEVESGPAVIVSVFPPAPLLRRAKWPWGLLIFV